MRTRRNGSSPRPSPWGEHACRTNPTTTHPPSSPAPASSANATPAERDLWAILRGGKLGARFRRQQPIGPLIVDFYCPAAGLVVELDGQGMPIVSSMTSGGRLGWGRRG